MDEREGERDRPEEGPVSAGQVDPQADAPSVVVDWSSPRVRLTGAIVVATLIAAGAFIVLGPVRVGWGGTQGCPPAATPVPGGLSRECAIELARTYLNNAGALISVRSGRYGTLRAVDWSQAVDPNRLVWVIEFVAPPTCVWGPSTPPTACFSYGPGIYTVVLDFATGESLFEKGAYH
jgi:hypothetical protein